MRKTAIVTPCYNEADRLNTDEFLSLTASSSQIVFIFVNDGSSDNTGEIIKTMVSKNQNNMRYINLEKNLGKAEAVRRGFQEAFDDSFEQIGFWDADLSTPLTAIDDLAGVMERENANIVIGSRVRLMGKSIERRASRHYLGRVFATMASLALNLPVYDTQCGAKLFRNTEFLRQVFEKPFMSDWIFDVETLARFDLYERAAGGPGLKKTLIEYPLKEWKDIKGSKMKPYHFVKAMWDMGRIIVKYSPKIYGSF